MSNLGIATEESKKFWFDVYMTRLLLRNFYRHNLKIDFIFDHLEPVSFFYNNLFHKQEMFTFPFPTTIGYLKEEIRIFNGRLTFKQLFILSSTIDYNLLLQLCYCIIIEAYNTNKLLVQFIICLSTSTAQLSQATPSGKVIILVMIITKHRSK